MMGLCKILRQGVSHEQGFTLVEMLVSLFIFAIISAGTMTVMTTNLRGKTQMDTRISEIQNIETMRALIKADMSNVISVSYTHLTLPTIYSV